MSDVETDAKREEEQRREEDERLDTAEDERRGEEPTEEVRRALQCLPVHAQHLRGTHGERPVMPKKRN